MTAAEDIERGSGVRASSTVIAVSLKMYFDPARTLEWSRDIAAMAREHPAIGDGSTQLVVLPSLPALPAAVQTFADTTVALGAQDLFYEDRGPYTGGVSGADLRQIGATYAEVGHVERRSVFGDTDRIVNLKTRAAWRNGLIPLLCVGESRRMPVELAAAECVRQLQEAVRDADPGAGACPLVVAYEPSWAIGGADPAQPRHITTVITRLREELQAISGLADSSIIYGGSAHGGLLSELNGVADGLFLGRFAHQAAALTALLDEMIVPL